MAGSAAVAGKPTPFEVDVLVVGAGPAGLGAGIVCARSGLRTLVCERGQLPQDKACGEGLMPSGLVALDRLGAKDLLGADEFHPFEGIRYISPRGRMAEGRFREGPGWGIPRAALSAALARRACQLPGLEVRQGAQVGRGEPHGDGWLVQVGGEWARARLLVGADGLNSAVRRWAGLDVSGPPVHRRWGARQHFAVCPWTDLVEVHWQAGLEAYLTPLGPERVGVAFLWDQRRFTPPQGGADLVAGLLSCFPALQRRLASAAPAGLPRAVGPLQRRTRGVAAPGMVLIGDAAGYLDALTGEGISLALAQALALEETVVPHLQAGRALSAQALAGYSRACASIQRPYYRMTGLALFLSQRPRLLEFSVAVLARQPALFQRLLSMNMGSL